MVASSVGSGIVMMAHVLLDYDCEFRLIVVIDYVHFYAIAQLQLKGARWLASTCFS